MGEASALLATFLAFACLHAPVARRRACWSVPLRRRWQPVDLGRRLAAVGLLAIGVQHWRAVEDVVAALLVVPAAFCAAATGLVLLAPIAPCLMWLSIAGGVPALVALCLLGGCGG